MRGMLRVTQSTSAEGAKTYFLQGLSRQDYYARDSGQEIIGRWHGQGAGRLGLSGEVTRDAFFALCDNQHPLTGEQLTPRQKEGRRVGYDFTFSAPKSVSLLHALSGDNRILDAFQASVQDTMREIEQDMQTRVRQGGATHDRRTGNMVWADFTHFTTRPIDGTPDMDLHAHCFAFNGTWDRVEARWKAGQFHDLHIDRPYYEAAFHARLAARMKALGFGIAAPRQGGQVLGHRGHPARPGREILPPHGGDRGQGQGNWGSPMRMPRAPWAQRRGSARRKA